MEPRRILFIPVSSPSGIGEYMRSIIIANVLRDRWPQCDVTFILNEQVSYLNDCPYQVRTCKDSPTKDVKAVNNIIKELCPDLVVFDASGRASQFKQAKAVGAKVAFISQHSKKRSRGLKLNRLFNTDIHWVVQADYCINPLNFWQRTKLRFLKVNWPQNIGPVYNLPSAQMQHKFLDSYMLKKNDFILFNAGSGGHKINGILAADIYFQAAQALQQKTSMKCVVVFGSNYPKELPINSDVTVIKSIENEEFISLLANAHSCVLSAGDTLLQCIDLGVPCVASAVSPDQPARLKVCASERLVIPASLCAEDIVDKATMLLDKAKFDKLIKKVKNKNMYNALSIIVNDIALLFKNNK